MRMLLEAGADPSNAIHCAVSHGDNQALEVLLIHGSQLYAHSVVQSQPSFGRDDDSILEYAIRRGSSIATLRLIIDAMTHRRQCFMSLAKKHLSRQKLIQFGWENPDSQETLLDSAASAVFDRLLILDIVVPEIVQPQPAPTIYHMSGLNRACADLLYSAGFREIDSLSVDGHTPLLLHAFDQRTVTLDIVEWFLENGARQMRFKVMNGISVVHAITGWLRRNSYYLGIHYSGMKTFAFHVSSVLTKLSSLIPLDTRDNCDCSYSVGGCSPITTLLKETKLFNSRIRKRVFKRWISYCPSQHISQREYLNACSFEIFERLEMRHTCCSIPERNIPSIIMLERSEIKELKRIASCEKSSKV